MTATKHKLRATIAVGDPDLGAEQECEITFTYLKGSPAVMYGDNSHPADPDEIEFVSARPFCNGKSSPWFYPEYQQGWLNDLAEDWLGSDDGQAEAFATVRADDEAAREYAAELRRDA